MTEWQTHFLAFAWLVMFFTSAFTPLGWKFGFWNATLTVGVTSIGILSAA